MHIHTYIHMCTYYICIHLLYYACQIICGPNLEAAKKLTCAK